MGPWAVSGPAAVIGARALTDDAWTAATRQALRGMTARMDDLLTEVGLTVIGGTDLFRLTHFAGALPVYHGLAKRGVLSRAFAARPGWLRFGLPADCEGFERFALALRAAMAEAGTGAVSDPG